MMKRIADAVATLSSEREEKPLTSGEVLCKIFFVKHITFTKMSVGGLFDEDKGD
ncbi:hypothetical protein LJC34_06575 [Oscillospiraceae bacterium OttesenSCG-928-G22]|nr:hypothetical protein [Oscillospiraceae bacterium OttesenSCG-928-G22]